ncbi:MAG TPA: tail fiber protein [Verrucomicrobiae bacterium]|jgi:microcystin-dependent protein|nr:tail fiber protein [Verrucomicrobiae bacterium]
MRRAGLASICCIWPLAFAASFVHAATVTTLSATEITPSSVTLNGVANPGGTSLYGSFQYGTTMSYGTTTVGQALGNGNSNTNFSQVISGLAGGQLYHYRAVIGTIFFPTVFGQDTTFFVPTSPVAVTTAATAIHPGEAILNASVNPNGLPTTYWFEHGATTNYGNFTPTNSLPVGISFVAVSNLVTDLPRGTNYHFRIVASNAIGQSFGQDLSFTVPQGLTGPTMATGGGQPYDIRQPSLEVNFIICTAGYYPSAVNDVPFMSEICLFAGNFAPAGWAFCQGQLLSINANYELYNTFGTTFGGDGITTFALPDFRGRRAVDSGQGLGLQTWVEGEQAGSDSNMLTVNQMPAHTHSLPFPDTATGSAGGGQTSPNTGPGLAVNYLIVLTGLYPIQNFTVPEPFLGQIMFTAYSPTLTGTAKTSGNAEPINQNQALYNLLSTNFGGNGQTTFNLPNIQSRAPIGAGQGPATLWSVGQSTGADYVTITAAQMPAHQHAIPSLGIETGIAGSNQPVNLLPPTLALQFVISTNGEMPSATVEATNAMIGEIQLFAGTNAPTGWAVCDGSVLQTTNCPALFAVISNYYGGDGVTTFALPDLRGRTPVGSSNGIPGAVYGAERIVLTEANLPPHTHTGPILDFDRWITSFGLSGNAASFSADADSDQADNGYEWATGTTPTNSSSLANLAIHPSGTNVLVDFPRNTNALDVVLTLQRTTNLIGSANWTGIATNVSGVWSPAGIVSELNSSNPANVNVSDTSTNSAVDYRLRISWP